MSDRELLRMIRDAAARLHLADSEIAVLAGVSLPTATAMRRDGRLPKLARCLRGFALLAQRAKLARSRADLGLS